MAPPAKKAKKQGSPAKNYCFTSFDMGISWEDLVASDGMIQYAGYAEEKCPDTGRAHQQGFLQCKKKARITALVKEDDRLKKVNFVTMRGTYDENVAYCSKEGDFKEFGAFQKKGARTRLFAAIQDIRDGCTIQDLWEAHPDQMCKYERGLRRCKKALQKKKFKKKFELNEFKWDPITEWRATVILWGKPGIGKTQFARAHFDNPLIVNHLDRLKELSDEHDGIIFDDMSFTHIPREAQIHLVDNEDEKEIHLRYENAIIPEGTKKIMITNVENGEIVDLEDEAIKQRCRVVHVEGPVLRPGVDVEIVPN